MEIHKEPEINKEDKEGSNKKQQNPSKLFFVLAVIVIAAAGIYGYMSATNDTNNGPEEVDQELSNTYESPDYNFGFAYSNDYNANKRKEENRDFEYLGEDVDFFLSFRDMVSDKKPVSIAFFYALPGGDVEQFEQMINDSDKAGEVTAVNDLDIGDLGVKEVVSSTAAGIDKTHYVFEREGGLIVISVFLNQKEAFQPTLNSLYATE